MRFLLVILLGGFALLGHAESAVPNSTQPGDGTLAMTMLYRVFGSIGGLHGTGSQIMSEMFRTFNSIILTFAGLLCTYTTFFGIANTANEGEILGKKWSSIWIPVRTIGGSLLLAPLASGYSAIQVLVMSIVVQGVGAADRVWESALSYLDRYGTIVESVDSINKEGKGPNNQFLIDSAGNMLKATTCMSMLNRALQIHYNDPDIPYFTVPTPTFEKTSAANLISKAYKAYVKLPGKIQYKKLDLTPYEGACGTIEWILPDTQSKYMTAAVQGMILNMSSMTDGIVNGYIFPAGASGLRMDPEGEKFPSVYGEGANSSGRKLENFLLAGNLLYAAYDFYGIMKPVLREASLSDEQKQKIMKDKEFLAQAVSVGFAGIGSFHPKLVRLNTQLRQLGEQYTLDQKNLRIDFKPDYHNRRLFPFSEKIMKSFFEVLPTANSGPIDQYIARERNLKGANEQASKYAPKSSDNTLSDDAGFFDKLSYVLLPFEQTIDRFQHDLEAELAKKQDPITALANIGHFLISAVSTTWLTVLGGTASTMAILVLISTASGAWMGLGIAPAINAVLGLISLLGLFVPLLATWMAINLTIGATLAYYVPLIPYILFFFGVLHWLAFVVEAIIAGPLIALGIMYPEGHDIMGKSEQAALLLTSVFLWPMLMVFGFILGIIVCTVAFELFCYTYSTVFETLRESVPGTTFIGKIVFMTAQIGFMSAFLVRVVTSSYSLIYEVRNKALRWIGGPIEHLTEAEALNRVEGATSKQSEHMGQTISSRALESGSALGSSATAGSKLGASVKEYRDRKKGIGREQGTQDGGNAPALPPQQEEG